MQWQGPVDHRALFTLRMARSGLARDIVARGLE